MFSQEALRAIEIAKSISKEYQHQGYSAAHLLKALLHRDLRLRSVLDAMGKDVFYLEDWCDVRLEEFPKSPKPIDSPAPDEKAEAVFNQADSVRLQLNREDVNEVCILAALATPGVGFTYEQLKSFPLLPGELLTESVGASSEGNTQYATKTDSVKSGGSGALAKYCVDKTKLASEGKIDPIIGRGRETRMVAEVLGRRTKPNVIITGEPGVGKTALVDGFALNIVQNKVPANLSKAIVFELDFGSLIAGASYKGEVEERLKQIIKEIKTYDRAILFIDEIHMLLDPKGGAAGASNLLKPELARGELTIIGATTQDEYRKYLETDEAFSRRFEVIKVEEPDEQSAIRMLQMLVPYYEKHHGIEVEPETVEETVRLAKRYVKDRRLPDSAIDLIDRTLSVVKLMGETSADEIADLQTSLDKVLSERNTLDEAGLLSELRWFHRQMTHKLSHVLYAQLEDKTKIELFDNADAFISYLQENLVKLSDLAGSRKSKVDKQDVAAVVSHKTGIPIGKVQASEQERLLHMEHALKGRVIGQDHALKAIADAVLESRSGLNKPGQPIGSFFFLGSTGTGKTELAKSIAEFLFGEELAMIRFDMSEFKEEHSAALLYGAPPGYVGYEEGGLLVNKIRQQPYAVVLFDEIEKAHPSVFDIFLQILDEGKMHDRLGKEGDFSNAIIIFTSNIGAEKIVEQFQKGEMPKSAELLESMQKYFRPEFLARITEIIPFAPVNEETIQKIFDIHFKGLVKLLDRMGIRIELSPEAAKQLSMEGFSPRYGVRPLSGVIRNRLRRPMSRMIIGGHLKKGDLVKVDVSGDGELMWEVVAELENVVSN